MNVLIIHRSPVVAKGICLVLKTAGVNALSEDWENTQALKAVLESFEPDVVLVDSQITGLDSGHFVSTVKDCNKETSVAIISIDQTPSLMDDAINSGASGFISLATSSDDLVASLRLLAAGQVVATGSEVTTLADVVTVSIGSSSQEFLKSLTRRETRIAEMIARGLTNNGVAKNLDLTEGTIKVHVRNIFRKLGISNRTELTGFVIRSGLID
ncbi:MAG: response regulator transcription factor [Chloroflexi bacterium]|nr:response regulator transcription factor [Chloroflexota bacterium]